MILKDIYTINYNMNFTVPVASAEHLNMATNYLRQFRADNKKYEKYDNYKNNDTNKKIAVIVEPRDHNLLEPIIRNACYFLNQHHSLSEKNTWNIAVVHGVNNTIIKEKLKNFDIKYINMMVDNISADEHNLFLQKVFFWNNFVNYDNVLIFQTDSCMLRPMNEEKFLKYDFVGARILNPHARTPNGYGMNGGFSLRNPKSMINCLKTVNFDIINSYRNKTGRSGFNPIKILAEDIYFWHSLELTKGSMPDKEILPEFSIETSLDFKYDYNGLKPCGIHGFNKNLLQIELFQKIFNEADNLQ